MDKTPSALNQAVAEYVRAELARRGIAPTTLATKLHVSPQTMANLVNGDAPWRVAYLEDIARVLGMRVSAIIDRADPTGDLSNFDDLPATFPNVGPLTLVAGTDIYREAELDEDLAWVADDSPDEDALRAERGEYPQE